MYHPYRSQSFKIRVPSFSLGSGDGVAPAAVQLQQMAWLRSHGLKGRGHSLGPVSKEREEREGVEEREARISEPNPMEEDVHGHPCTSGKTTLFIFHFPIKQSNIQDRT